MTRVVGQPHAAVYSELGGNYVGVVWNNQRSAVRHWLGHPSYTGNNAASTAREVENWVWGDLGIDVTAQVCSIELRTFRIAVLQDFFNRHPYAVLIRDYHQLRQAIHRFTYESGHEHDGWYPSRQDLVLAQQGLQHFNRNTYRTAIYYPASRQIRCYATNGSLVGWSQIVPQNFYAYDYSDWDGWEVSCSLWNGMQQAA